MKKENGIFIFRRDFRVVDNTALIKLSKLCKNIYPIFIFTPEQVSDKNKYKSESAVQFMIESLQELSNEIREYSTLSKSKNKLYSFYGENSDVINYLITQLEIEVIAFNYDYSPYAIKRDEQIRLLCAEKKIELVCDHDYYLQIPNTVLNGANETYKKFTPFYNNFLTQSIRPPYSKTKTASLHIGFASIKHIDTFKNRMPLNLALHKFTSNNPYLIAYGGRPTALLKLKQQVKSQNKYDENRNNLNKQTSELSAYIKFGCISIREVYKEFNNKKNKAFIRQLIWRDFYANILYSFPFVLGKSLKPAYDNLKWDNNIKYINAWKEGRTGFPIVDAGMRQLNKTGYMHNRARLITASFLVKTLIVDWRIGERYFATQLRDYDPASNNGNWQWISGGGADSQPYFRIFSPWEQAKKHDPTCEYIKEWVPELEIYSTQTILNWDTEYEYNMNKKEGELYIKPIVDYSKQKNRLLEKFQKEVYPS
jgi:deoxyribodipyrimidine photo-lyase